MYLFNKSLLSHYLARHWFRLNDPAVNKTGKNPALKGIEQPLIADARLSPRDLIHAFGFQQFRGPQAGAPRTQGTISGSWEMGSLDYSKLFLTKGEHSHFSLNPHHLFFFFLPT
jgi:hypothetical protein